MKFDAVYYNANIISMDPEDEVYHWIGVKDGKIEGLGKETFPRIVTENQYKAYDMKGRTILPGLSDCHVHVLNTGILKSSVLLSDCDTLKEVLEKMEDRCREEPGDGWVFGSCFLVQKIAEQRYPTRQELDRISHGHKVILFAATMHACALNSTGDQIAGVPEDMPGVMKEGGLRTGVYVSDESVFLANRNVFSSFSDDELWSLIESCAEYAVTKGVTSIHGLFGQFVAEDRDVDLVLERKKKLPLEMVVFHQTWDPGFAASKGLERVGGCLTLDGAAFEYTMANFEPYEDRPELRGVLYHNDQNVYDFVSEAHRRDMQCTMHAVGERAIDQLLYTYHRVFAEQGRKKLRHRIEHFCLPTDTQIQMAKELDLILSMQPGFSYLWDGENRELEAILGRKRADRIDPFKKIIERGILVVSGSDNPVTDIDPLLYIASCTDGYNPVRNIPLKEAIKMCTINAAYSIGKEKEKGTLEIGKDADFAVISQNPYGTGNLYTMKALGTVKAGKKVYWDKEGF